MCGCVSGRLSGCAGEPSGITQPPGPQAALRITTQPGRGGQCPRWPSRAWRTLAGPTSSTVLAPSLPLQLLKVALHILLWSAASPELTRGKGIRNHWRGSRKHSRKSWEEPFHVKEGKSAASSTPRQAAREVPQTALTCREHAKQCATARKSALLAAVVPSRSHILKAERTSGVCRRDRKSRRGGKDIFLLHARLKLMLLWSGCGKRGRLGAGRTTNSGGPSDTRVCVLPGSTVLALGLQQAASRLLYRCCRSSTRTWIIRRSLTTLCGRTFAISCSAGHSMSWWLDHRHPPSRLMSGTRSMFMGTRNSSARKRGLHPSDVDGIRITDTLADRTAKAYSLVQSWERGFLVRPR